MRVTWNASISVATERAEKNGHRLTPFGSIEGKRFGLAVRRSRCMRCGMPVLIVRNKQGLLVVAVDEKAIATLCDPKNKSLRQLAA